jgi:hypothetical protein
MSIVINAPQQNVINIYNDFKNWDKLFPATIKSTHLIKEENQVQTVEIERKRAGKAVNVLKSLSANEIELEEFRPTYNAIFLHRFETIQSGTMYILEVHIFFKGIFRVTIPFIEDFVSKRLKNYMLKPIKKFAENNMANTSL